MVIVGGWCEPNRGEGFGGKSVRIRGNGKSEFYIPPRKPDITIITRFQLTTAADQ